MNLYEFWFYYCYNIAIFCISLALTVLMFIGGERHGPLLGGTLSSMRVVKGAAKVLRLLEEM